MTRPKPVTMLAKLAMVFAIASVIAHTIAVLQGNAVQWPTFIASVVVLIGASSRIRKPQTLTLSEA